MKLLALILLLTACSTAPISTPTTVSLAWSEDTVSVPFGTHYRVYAATNGAAPLLISEVAAPATQAQVSVQAGSNYLFTVTAFSSLYKFESEPSNQVRYP